MILKSCTRKIASCPLYLQSESVAKLGVPTMVRATTIAPLAQYVEVMAFIEEFDDGFLQPLIIKNSDEAGSSLPSLEDSRIRDKQCLKLPPKWIVN